MKLLPNGVVSKDNSKESFLKTWPGGYTENWEVYGKSSGKSEEEVVSKCLSPFYSKDKTALEVGCGSGFWTKKYLSPNFKQVIALDLLPSKKYGDNVKYIEVPDRDFKCYGIPSDSIDFCWSFGVFCHISLDACQEYLHSIYRVLESGGEVSLYFSNNDRRPITNPRPFSDGEIQWVKNDYETTMLMMLEVGFDDIQDLMPDLHDTMIYGKKP